MRVVFIQQKNGLLASCWRFMKSIAAAEVSSSIVSMRFFVKRPCIFDRLFADFSEAWIDSGIVFVCGLAPEHTTRTEFCPVSWIFGIIPELGFFLGVEMIKVSKKFVETVYSGQIFVPIAYVILTELARGVTEVLKQAANRRIKLAHAHGRSWVTYLRESAPDDVLAGKESRAAGGA